MLVESQPKVFYFTDHYRDYPMVLIRLSKAKRATVEPLLRRQWRALASKKAVKAFDASRTQRGALARHGYQEEFLAAALRNPVNEIIADELFRLALPDAWIVSGCLVQTVWNVLTDARRRLRHRRLRCLLFRSRHLMAGRGRRDPAIAGPARNDLGVTIEVRNQARVHLWYPQKHGLPYPALRSFDRRHRPLPDQEIPRSESAARSDGHDVYAPNGFDDIAGLIVRPNPGAEFLGGELRGEGRALEKAVAGNHGAAGDATCCRQTSVGDA